MKHNKYFRTIVHDLCEVIVNFRMSLHDDSKFVVRHLFSCKCLRQSFTLRSCDEQVSRCGTSETETSIYLQSMMFDELANVFAILLFGSLLTRTIVLKQLCMLLSQLFVSIV